MLKVWLNIAQLPKASFYEWNEKLDRITEIELVNEIKEIVSDSKLSYGYRRVTYALRKK